MSKGEKKAYLSRAFISHAQNIEETLQMLEKPAPSSLDKVDWSQVIKLGDEISKQATIVGMLWSGEEADVKELESNMGVYCNMLNGFLLLCHGSSVGAGPTLHANIQAAAKQVTNCSLSLFNEAVSSCELHSSKRKLTIPQLSGSVWEACATLKKVPTTNCTAVGRAITEVAVLVKDVLREMKELKPAASGTADDTPSGTAGNPEEDHLSEGCLGADLSPEEMGIAQLSTGVVSDMLVLIKELIRFITSLVKKSNSEVTMNDYNDSLERLLSHCQEMGAQINELGVFVYPPQDILLMKSIVKKMYDEIDEVGKEVRSIEGPPEGLLGAFDALKCSLGKLESGVGCLDDDVVSEMTSLSA